MDPSFGARLRAHREEKQIALGRISEETKIKASMLEGLERDDVSQWPEGIFRRAYIRAYARSVGLDPETLVREFLEAHPDPVLIQPEETTELEEPQWPAGFRRLVNTAKAVVPLRQRQTGDGSAQVPAELPAAPGKPAPQAEPVQAELNLSRGKGDLSGGKDDAGPRSPLTLAAAAELCTRLGRVVHRREVLPVLEDAAMALDAVGVIVWKWDPRIGVLRPSLAYGYTDAAVSRMPRVRPDGSNAIATAFQSGRPSVVRGGDESTGAVAVPLMGHGGCVGVLAIELRHGDERRDDVLAFVAILAAQLVSLAGPVPMAEAVNS